MIAIFRQMIGKRKCWRVMQKMYSSKICPVCGTENKKLILEETNGRYICALCGRENTVSGYKSERGRVRCGNGMQSDDDAEIAER